MPSFWSVSSRFSNVDRSSTFDGRNLVDTVPEPICMGGKSFTIRAPQADRIEGCYTGLLMEGSSGDQYAYETHTQMGHATSLVSQMGLNEENREEVSNLVRPTMVGISSPADT